nr:hypothetical protein [Tanacetum cinerariifolium]
MELDIKEERNEPEMIFPYEEADPLNPTSPAFYSQSEDVVEVEDMVEPEDDTVLNSVHETAHALVEKKGKSKDKYYGKLILDLGNEVQASVEEGATTLEKELEENLVMLKKEFSTRVQAHEFYQEMIRRGFVFKERPDEAINVPIKDEESPSSKPRGSPCCHTPPRRKHEA